MSSWFLMEILHSLYGLGIFDELKKNSKGLSVERLSQLTKTKNLELKTSLDFVSLHLPDILERGKGSVYRLTTVYDSRTFQNLLHFSRSYAPVVHSVSELTAGTKLYGPDVARDSSALSISSELYIQITIKEVIDLVLSNDPEVAVDLGCGSGFVVEAIAENQSHIQSVGVDIDEVKNFSNLENVSYIKGDVTTPEEWIDQMPLGRTVLVASMVMHEFLYYGEGNLITILNKYSKYFKGSLLYLVESDGHTYDQLKQLPAGYKESVSFYQSMHPFTKQGMPLNTAMWNDFFHKHDLHLIKSFSFQPNVTVYCLQL